MKSKTANGGCAGTHFESLQVDILGVKALLQKNDILLASKSVRVMHVLGESGQSL